MGIPGISLLPNGKYFAIINRHDKCIEKTGFLTLEEAYAWRCEQEKTVLLTKPRNKALRRCRPDLSRIKEIVYLRSDGRVCWQSRLEMGSNRRFANRLVSETSRLVPDGYRRPYLDGHCFGEHQLAFILAHDREIRKGFVIDHIDGDKANNNPSNLREVTRSQNSMNHGRQGAGVHFLASGDRWQALITAEGRCYDLGTFRNKADAIAARACRRGKVSR